MIWKYSSNIHFFKKFFNGNFKLDSQILESGANLSGGDKQKIAIARLFLENNDVIILDEITNSIDNDTAEEIMYEIIDRYKNSIIFIITHDKLLSKFFTKSFLI